MNGGKWTYTRCVLQVEPRDWLTDEMGGICEEKVSIMIPIQD